MPSRPSGCDSDTGGLACSTNGRPLVELGIVPVGALSMASFSFPTTEIGGTCWAVALFAIDSGVAAGAGEPIVGPSLFVGSIVLALGALGMACASAFANSDAAVS